MECQHWWLLEAPDARPGPETLGTCKHCGDVRGFSPDPDRRWSDQKMIDSRGPLGFPVHHKPHQRLPYPLLADER